MKAIAFTPAQPHRLEAPDATSKAGKAKETAPSPEHLKAARDFEAIFLRTLLAPLEKTTQLGSKSSMSAGQSTFGGMVVSAMADSLSNAGGLGLADVVARALSAHASPQNK